MTWPQRAALIAVGVIVVAPMSALVIYALAGQ